MDSIDIEKNYILRILNINHGKYCVGISQEQGLVVSEEWISCMSSLDNGTFQQIDFSLKTKEMRISERDRNYNELIPVNRTDIESFSVIDILNNGLRWEGPCLNESPFGYGSLYNNSNELVYRGVMIGDNKECFGIVFYPDLGKVEYIGCYCNNKRHGFGTVYDRKGELVYEGDWLYDSNGFETTVVLKNTGDEGMIHSLIHEIVIDEGCGNDYKGDLRLGVFNHLERIVVKKESFQNVNSLVISDNPVLKSIEIEDGDWRDDYLNTGAFNNVKSVVLKSVSMIDD